MDVEKTALLLATKYAEGTEALKTPRPVDEIVEEINKNFRPLTLEERLRPPLARGEPEVTADKPAEEPAGKQQAAESAGESVERVAEPTSEQRQKWAETREENAFLRLQLALRGIPFDEDPANEPSQNAANEPSQNAADEPTENAGSASGDDAAKEPGECNLRSSVRLCGSDKPSHA